MAETRALNECGTLVVEGACALALASGREARTLISAANWHLLWAQGCWPEVFNNRALLHVSCALTGARARPGPDAAGRVAETKRLYAQTYLS